MDSFTWNSGVVLSQTEGHPKPAVNIGVVYHRTNSLTLGSVLAVAKNHLDKLYVILGSVDERASRVARSLGAEVIYAPHSEYLSVLCSITALNNIRALVTFYGDGSHDPENIPELIKYLEDGYDAVIGHMPASHARCVNETVYYLNNKKPKNSQSGFIACSPKLLGALNLNACSASNVLDIAQLIQTNAGKNGFKVQHVFFSDATLDVLNLYKIGVVVPSYNEELLIEETIRGIPKYVDRIYVIDDCSTDRTPEILKNMTDPRIVSVRNAVNMGVGATIVKGYKRALEDEMDIVAIMAGDNQMDPGQLPRLLMPIIDGKADYTKGNRLISKEFRKGMSRWRFLGNTLLTFITKVGSGYWNISDPQNGYTAISRNALEALDLDSIYTYYGYCNDMLVKLNALGFRVVDIAIPARYGREKSSIKYSKYIFKVSPMLLRGFLWRLKTKYVVLGFNPLVLFYALGMILLPLGLLLALFALAQWAQDYPVSPSLSLLVAFMTLIGLQLLLFAMLFDMQSDGSKNLAG